MNRLNEAVLARFVEENALIALGDAEEARATQDALLTLAESLGLRNDRIANARRQWRGQCPCKRRPAAAEKKKPRLSEAQPQSAPTPPQRATAAAEGHRCIVK